MGLARKLLPGKFMTAVRATNAITLCLIAARCMKTFLNRNCSGTRREPSPGAISQKRGLIEAADGGTLFLDEIGEISPAAQAKLLRVIETRQFRRVGGVKDLTADTRIIAATNRDLAAMAKEGRFRQDLYYRLSAFVVRVPPLRERREDIPLLARYFLEKHDFSRRIRKELSRTAERTLVAYDWPGNVRELRNVMERAIILSGSEPAIMRATSDCRARAARSVAN